MTGSSRPPSVSTGTTRSHTPASPSPRPQRRRGLSRLKAAWRLAVLALLLCAAVASVMIFGADHAHAQGDENDYVDVAVTLEYPDQPGTWRAVDIVVMNHGTRTAYDVEVVVHIVYPENASYFRGPLLAIPVGVASLENNGYSYRWSIPALAGLQREIIEQQPIAALDYSPTDRDAFDKTDYPHQFSAEVTTSSFERDTHKANNTHRIWTDSTGTHSGTKQTKGDYSIDNLSVDEANPSPGDLVNFSISATIRTNIDTQIAVELTDGLTVDLDSTAEPPREISYSYRPPAAPQPSYTDGVITIGTRPFDDKIFDLYYATIPVRVASTAVVNQQCLTATISGNPPPGAGPFNDDVNDNVARACLRDRQAPFADGVIDTFTVFPCVGITDAPCDSTDDIRMRAVDQSTASPRVTDVGEVTINVPYIPARTYDGQVRNGVLQSINSADHISWQTASAPHEDFEGTAAGVHIGFNRVAFNDHLADWTTFAYSFSANGIDGNPPGGLHIRTPFNGQLLFSLNSGNSWTTSLGPYNLSNTVPNTAKWFIEFEKLGTYFVTLSTPFTHATETGDCDTDGDNVNDAFCASETIIFHVGPMADLTVEDGGTSPYVATDQHSLTIVAVNNGPDRSPGATVTGLPTQADVIHISHGSYDPTSGEWDISPLSVAEYYQSAGVSLPTLTLAASPSDTADVSITNSKIYEVCIGGKDNPGDLAHTTQTACEGDADPATTNDWYAAVCVNTADSEIDSTITVEATCDSTTDRAWTENVCALSDGSVFANRTEAECSASWNSTPVPDYITDNNTATITAVQGTAGTEEGVPTFQTPQVYTPAVDITWSEVEFIYGVPVRDYQVHWSANGVSGWTQLQTDLTFPNCSTSPSSPA